MLTISFSILHVSTISVLCVIFLFFFTIKCGVSTSKVDKSREIMLKFSVHWETNRSP